MRWAFVLLFLATLSIKGFCQSDTAWLNNVDKVVAREGAVRYALQYQEQGYWKRKIYDQASHVLLQEMQYKDQENKEASGPFRSYFRSGGVSREGQYDANKKVGVWKAWSSNGKLIDSAFYKDGYIYGLSLKWASDGTVADSLVFDEGGKGKSSAYWPTGVMKQHGSYEKGMRQGAWVYYHRNGNKSQDAMFEADSAVSFTCYDEQGIVQTTDCYFEKEAEFPGGEMAWRNYLSRKLSEANLPKEYYKGKIAGVVQVQFVVDVDGSLTDITILRSLHPDMDKAVIRVLSSARRWRPAIQYNRRVKAYRTQPITFGPGSAR